MNCYNDAQVLVWRKHNGLTFLIFLFRPAEAAGCELE
jgi:hypothetical protein